MDAPLNGTVALVTGASSGIGEGIARGLAADGAIVALVARRIDRLKALAGELAETGSTTLVVEADVADEQQARDAVARTVAEAGRLDIVVNNAGVMLSGPVSDAIDGEWEKMLAVNIGGTLNVTRAALPHLQQAAASGPRNVADIVTISSTSGRVARPGHAVYSLTKFGVNAFSEALRQEMLPHRVRVGVVEPGVVETEIVASLRGDFGKQFLEQVSAVTLMQPSDIADAVRYMVSRDRRVAVNEMLVRAGEQTW
ncbi:SDR family NAD(P)-dependent oxidoreductase [Actinoplanes sp. CA-030573]|uniref:SDR family NAD(P)-dependent oxidoreductase n=1 Tax=Actinoplanes sp. CA-030573 TaxID=3239898 RepID=UPI003D8FC842